MYKAICFKYSSVYMSILGFPAGSAGKESPCDAEDAGDSGSIPGLGRCPGGGVATHSSILAWKIR